MEAAIDFLLDTIDGNGPAVKKFMTEKYASIPPVIIKLIPVLVSVITILFTMFYKGENHIIVNIYLKILSTAIKAYIVITEAQKIAKIAKEES